MRDWCLSRLKQSEEEMAKAKDYAARGNVAIGDSMRELREDAKVSLRAIARRLDVSAPYLSDLELGRRNWSAVMVSNFVDAVGREFLSENVEAWHPLPGAPLRIRLRFVATLRLRLGAGSGLLSAVLFALSFWRVSGH